MKKTASQIAHKYIGPSVPRGVSPVTWKNHRDSLKNDIKNYSKELVGKVLQRLAETHNAPDMVLTEFDDLIE